MTTPTINPDTFLMGGGATAARFENVGDKIAGTISEAPEVRQQTDIATGEPVFWPSGDPKMQLIVTLQTTQRDDADDDGKRRLYIKGKSLTEAVREAVKKTGAKGLEVGGTLTVTYTGDGTASQRGFNPPKLYSATYVRPDTTAQSGEFLGVTQPTAATAPPAPAPPPQPAPTPQPAPQPAPVASGPSAEQIAALQAAGIDPKTVFPSYTG